MAKKSVPAKSGGMKKFWRPTCAAWKARRAYQKNRYSPGRSVSRFWGRNTPCANTGKNPWKNRKPHRNTDEFDRGCCWWVAWFRIV